MIVTGASAGVGRAVATRFARAGDRIGLIARDAGALEDARLEAEQAGAAKVAIATADVADPDALFAAAQGLEAELGPVDIWVNDAMETVFSPLAEMSPEEFRRVTEVTYLGFVHGTMAALKSMRPRNRGRIVQIGSALAYRGIPLQSAYCGAKHAIRGFTDSVRTELLHEASKVTIAMIDLPAVNTPQFDWARVHIDRQPRPMGRPVEPEVVADAVFKAAGGGWREYWLGWPTLETIVGNILWPGALDRYLGRKAVAGQQTDQPVSPERPDNLFGPVYALHRTRGSFSGESSNAAVLIPAPLARLTVVGLGALACVALGMATGRLRAAAKPGPKLRARRARPAP
ncbi:SDR family oxidoreductase [Phenylobacterium sp.]|uniref:SDR family oxidoreductase n=1 Tax=Phenylobacterium sp. TaxID=1871053 RepID=UPI002D76C7CC|nr:SDR family oxidoreductase [Phenylobacterium sp.]